MTLIRWEPSRETESFQQEVSRLFGSFFDSQTGRADQRAQRRWVPAMDLLEDDGEYVLRADLPGVSEADIKIELEDNVLTVAGERRSEREERRDGYHRVERVSGSFSRTLRLPEGVDPESVRADLENGVLEVRIPKPQQRKPHRVAIGLGGGAAAVSSDRSGESEHLSATQTGKSQAA